VVACCAGVWRSVGPYVQQWPASIATDRAVAGLVTTEDKARSTRAKSMLHKIDAWYDQDSFTALYADAADRRRLVTVFGVTRFIWSPGPDLDQAFDAVSGGIKLTGPHQVDVGPPGGEARCGAGQTEGRALVACGWADHGSLGIVLFTNRSEADSAALMQTIRTKLIIRRHVVNGVV
jgi:hypothetical protein